jgi:hypothetical protein
MKKLSFIVFIAISGMFLAQSEKSNESVKLKRKSASTQNFFTDGTKLKLPEERDLNKIKSVITDFSKQITFCGFLKGYGSNTSITVIANDYRCFTWVFSRNGKVTSMQSVQAVPGQSYNGYSTNGDTVGISCECIF